MLIAAELYYLRNIDRGMNESKAYKLILAKKVLPGICSVIQKESIRDKPESTRKGIR